MRPGGDAHLLLGVLHVIFAEGRVAIGRLATHIDGVDELRALAARFPPARVAARAGIDAERIAGLAREFAAAPSAVAYGRVGVCTQEFGGLAAWLVNALNIVTGNLDRPGGAMFPTPAADLVSLASRLGERGHFGAWKSRVRGLPEFAGELPVAALAEEILTPGEDRSARSSPTPAIPSCRRRTARVCRARSAASTSWCRSTSIATRRRATPT